MEELTKLHLRYLNSISNKYCSHKISENSFTAPAFLNFLSKPVTIDDMPMQSNNLESDKYIGKNPTEIPWEDSIKNFIFDLTSAKKNEHYSTYFILADTGNKYLSTEAYLLSKRDKKKNTVVVTVSPVDETYKDFKLDIFRNNKEELSYTTTNSYLVTDLHTWCIDMNMLILCHTTSVKEYKEFISMLPNATWSVSCTANNFIESKHKIQQCTYILPVYSHPGSSETRAKGSGTVNFLETAPVNGYLGKLSYYMRCIRGSKQSSGLCYDCEVLNLLITDLLEISRDSGISTDVVFTKQFLDISNI